MTTQVPFTYVCTIRFDRLLKRINTVSTKLMIGTDAGFKLESLAINTNRLLGKACDVQYSRFSSIPASMLPLACIPPQFLASGETFPIIVKHSVKVPWYAPWRWLFRPEAIILFHGQKLYSV